MTEAEWLACLSPAAMFDFLRTRKFNRARNGRRRLRLVGCACIHRVHQFLTKRGRNWLAVAESIADGSSDARRVQKARAADFGPCDGQRTDHQADIAAWFALAENIMIACEAAAGSAVNTIQIDAWHRTNDQTAAKAGEQKAQAPIVRDVFGTLPFHPVTFDPRWQTADALGVAQAIYDDRAFERLPILADALMDAGCDSDDILAHCRSDGPHVRGCWVVDLVLGKQ